jgi:RNA polymerase sigma-70 factor (ECF subfamily)
VLFEHYRSTSGNASLDEEGQPEPQDKRADALDIVSAQEIKLKVRTILLSLPERDRLLLKAVFLDERDRDEVCEEFSVDRDYLRVLLHRAKQEFKTEYVKHVGTSS